MPALQKTYPALNPGQQFGLRMAWLVALVIMGVNYFPGGLYFLNDDFIHIPLSSNAVFGQHHSVRIVGEFSLYLDSLLYQTNPLGYHITNLLLHLLCTAMVGLTTHKILRSVQLEHSTLAAHSAAIFFAVYPFHSESVLWIIGRTGSLSCLLFLVALWLHLRHNRKLIILGLIFQMLGLFTYESVLFYPCIPLILSFWNRHEKPALARHWMVVFIGATITTAIYFLVRLQWLGQITDQYESANLLRGNFTGLAKNYFSLAGRLFIPPMESTWWFTTAVISVFTILFALCFWYRKALFKTNAGFLALSIMLALSLLPYVSLGIDTHGVESERYLYLPSAILAWIFGAWYSRLRNTISQWIGMAALVLVSSWYLHRSSQAYRTASAFANEVINIVHTHCETGQPVVLFNMPGESYGAVLFRVGLPEGIKWLAKGCQSSTVQLVDPNLDPLLQIETPPAVVGLDDKAAFYARTGITTDETLQDALLIAWHNNQLIYTK